MSELKGTFWKLGRPSVSRNINIRVTNRIEEYPAAFIRAGMKISL